MLTGATVMLFVQNKKKHTRMKLQLENKQTVAMCWTCESEMHIVQHSCYPLITSPVPSQPTREKNPDAWVRISLHNRSILPRHTSEVSIANVQFNSLEFLELSTVSCHQCARAYQHTWMAQSTAVASHFNARGKQKDKMWITVSYISHFVLILKSITVI